MEKKTKIQMIEDTFNFNELVQVQESAILHRWRFIFRDNTYFELDKLPRAMGYLTKSTQMFKEDKQYKKAKVQ